MNLTNHPCWHVAMHEASHIAVFLKLGGKWGSGKEVQIRQSYGSVRFSGLSDRKYGFLLDYCVLAAGVAADRIQGVPSFDGEGSDTYHLKDLAIDFKFSTMDIELVINKVQRWLIKNHEVVEEAAKSMILSVNKDGQVPKTKSKLIVQKMIHGMPSRRKLVKGRKSARR